MQTLHQTIKTKYPTWKDSTVQELVDNIMEFAINGVSGVDQAIYKLKIAEQTDEAKNLVAFIMASQEAYKGGREAKGLEPRYFGEENMRVTLKDKALADLVFHCSEYVAPDGEVGYTIIFQYDVGDYTLTKAMGVGSEAKNHDWIANKK